MFTFGGYFGGLCVNDMFTFVKYLDRLTYMCTYLCVLYTYMFTIVNKLTIKPLSYHYNDLLAYQLIKVIYGYLQFTFGYDSPQFGYVYQFCAYK